MFMTIYTILAICLIIWFLITDRKHFSFWWCLLICVGLYVLLPVIIFAAIIYFILYVFGKIDAR